MSQKIKPGTPCPASGQYRVVGPKGGKQPGEVTSTEGKPMPPTAKPNQSYTLVDPTKHKK